MRLLIAGLHRRVRGCGIGRLGRCWAAVRSTCVVLPEVRCAVGNSDRLLRDGRSGRPTSDHLSSGACAGRADGARLLPRVKGMHLRGAGIGPTNHVRHSCELFLVACLRVAYERNGGASMSAMVVLL